MNLEIVSCSCIHSVLADGYLAIAQYTQNHNVYHHRSVVSAWFIEVCVTVGNECVILFLEVIVFFTFHLFIQTAVQFYTFSYIFFSLPDIFISFLILYEVIEPSFADRPFVGDI